VRSFSYTTFGDLEEAADCTDGDTFVTGHIYDDRGRESVTTYPQVGSSRLAVQYNYTHLGFLYYVSDATDGSLYWAGTARNTAGQVTSEFTRNGVQTTSIRNFATGWLMGSQSVAHADSDTLIQSWVYQFDELGNLRHRSRTDAVNGSPSDETFTYDELNRLHTSTVNVGSDQYNETYEIDPIGNLTTKGDKHLTYGTGGGCTTAGPHAVCTVDQSAQYQYDGNGNMLTGGDRSVAYNLANKVVSIQSAAAGVNFIYGADGKRVVQETTGGGSTARTVYVGLGATGKSIYERTTRDDGTVEHTHFLYALGEHGGNAFAIKVLRGTQGDGAQNMSFNHFDHLGSVTAVSDDEGRVVNAAWGGGGATVAGYDPWGARRSPDGRPADPASSFQPLPGHREYTGHETIPGVGLVNMNGRVYDPAIGRFLSPDPNVQFVADLQSYNRYSYVLNNPLRNTDPTGYFSVSAQDIIGYFFTAVAIACTAVTDGACAPFATIFLTTYNVAAMSASGASFDQIVEVNSVGLVAGLVTGGALSAGMEADAPIAAQMMGGAMASAGSTLMTHAVLGGSLGGEQLLVGMAEGALSAGLSAWHRGTNPVTKADAATAMGDGDGEEAWGGWGNRDAYWKSEFLTEEKQFLASAPPGHDASAGEGSGSWIGEKAVRGAQFKMIKSIAGNVDLPSGRNQLVLWCTESEQAPAMDFAHRQGMVTLPDVLDASLDGTFVRSALEDRLPLVALDRSQKSEIYLNLSLRLADQASGYVTVFFPSAPAPSMCIDEVARLATNPQVPTVLPAH